MKKSHKEVEEKESKTPETDKAQGEVDPFAALDGLAAELNLAPDERDETIEKLKKELLYQAAEVENFKRRTQKRYEDMIKFATEPLIKDLLQVVDNLERALEHAGESQDSLNEGVALILNQLRSALARHGVEEIAAEGVKFDPNFHEALAQVPGDSEGMVAQVIEKGYTIHQKLLRPARVLVTRLA